MRLALFLILFFYSLSSFAIEGKLRILSDKIEVGEMTKGELIIWPLPKEIETLKKFKELKNDQFVRPLFLRRVESAEYSPHNPEALVLSLHLIARAPFSKGDNYLWQVGDNSIKVEVSGVGEKNGTYQKSFIIMSPPSLLEKKIYLYFLPIILLIPLFFLFKKRKKEVKKDLKKEILLKLEEQILAGSFREAAEFLYGSRTEALEILPSSELRALLTEVSVIQYKRDWSAIEEESVKRNLTKVLSDFKEKCGLSV